MRLFTTYTLGSLLIFVSLLLGCGRTERVGKSAQTGDEQILNLYDWADDVAPDTISSFEKLTGIKVHVSYFDSNETLRTRLLTGQSGFDVVVPSVAFLQREIISGAYLPLDKTKLPNLAKLDPAIKAQIAPSDPDNAHTVPYMWGTIGIGYNENLVTAALPNVALDSWHLIFDPKYAAKLAQCGINMIDDPLSVINLTLLYLGKTPNAATTQDLAEVEKELETIRPFVRTFQTSAEIEAMANGDICISLGYGGDMVQARKRAAEANKAINIRYVIPKEGSMSWITLLAIPRDAAHPDNAHRFINYMMNPENMGKVTNAVGFANALPSSLPFLQPSIASDTIIYPTPAERQRLIISMEPTPEINRAITRLWQKFKTGQ